MSSRLRGAVSRLVREIEDGMLVEVSSKFECDLAKTLLADIKTALAEPLRNCEVGTAEEQNIRHGEWCRKHGIDGDGTVACAHPDMGCHLCFARWSQMPYEEALEK